MFKYMTHENTDRYIEALPFLVIPTTIVNIA